MVGRAPYFWKQQDAWYVNVTKPDGKTTKRFLGKTKRQALEEFKKIASAPVGDDRAFFELSDAWLAYQLKRHSRGEVSTEWLKRVNRTIEKFSESFPGILLSDVTPAKMQTWLPSGSSSSYERTEFATIKQCTK